MTEMFFKEVYFAHQGYIYLINNNSKNGNTVKYDYNLKCNLFLF